jgi:hypothetical protein
MKFNIEYAELLNNWVIVGRSQAGRTIRIQVYQSPKVKYFVIVTRSDNLTSGESNVLMRAARLIADYETNVGSDEQFDEAIQLLSAHFELTKESVQGQETTEIPIKPLPGSS